MGFITLDADKAFDVIGHEHLMCKLYHDGLMDDLWNFIGILQTESITKIKWRGNLGDIFFNRQGIRQGDKLSPSIYKRSEHIDYTQCRSKNWNNIYWSSDRC